MFNAYHRSHEADALAFGHSNILALDPSQDLTRGEGQRTMDAYRQSDQKQEYCPCHGLVSEQTLQGRRGYGRKIKERHADINARSSGRYLMQNVRKIGEWGGWVNQRHDVCQVHHSHRRGLPECTEEMPYKIIMRGTIQRSFIVARQACTPTVSNSNAWFAVINQKI